MDSLPLHPFHRAVVLPDHKVVFIPTPKTGCTTVLWSLAVDVLGLAPGRFTKGTGGEVTASMAIHSRGLWPETNVPPPGDVYRTMRDGWAWFTVVRDPWRRLWSAWQSKILLGEPYFLRRFGRLPWFPDEVRDAAEVREAFRDFVLVLGSDDSPHDFHWSSQCDYLRPDVVPYTHVGRTERLQSTIDLLLNVCGVDAGTAERRSENETPLPFDPSLFDDRTREVVDRLYRDDDEQFSYPVERPAGDPDGWAEQVDALVPAVNMIRERSRRLDDVQRRSASLRRKLRRTRADLQRLESDVRETEESPPDGSDGEDSEAPESDIGESQPSESDAHDVQRGHRTPS